MRNTPLAGQDSTRRILSVLILLIAAAGALRFVGTGVHDITYRYSLNLGEAPLAQSILLLKEGISPYRKLDKPPYSLMPYGPVYPMAVSMAAQRERPFAAGRAVTFAATLAAAFLVGRIVSASGAGRIPAVLTGLLFLNLPYIERWGVQVNVDMTAVALDLAAACFFLRAVENKLCLTNRRFAAGIALSVLAFFTKSSAVIAPGGLVLYLLAHRRFKEAVWFGAAEGGIVLAVTALFNLGTSGSYSFHTAYEISRRLFFWAFIPILWTQALKDTPLLCAAALGYLILCVKKRKPSYPALCLAVSALLTVSLGKQGSETNYFLFFMAYGSVAAGCLLGMTKGRRGEWFYWVMLAGIAAQLLAYRAWDIRPVFLAGKDRQAQEAFFDRIAQSIKKVPDPILSWDMSLLLANGRPIYFEPFPMAQMSYSGVWDETVILKEIEAKKFKMAILYFYAPLLKKDRNFTPGFLEAFKANYRFVGRIAIPWDPKTLLFFYVPKSPSQ